VAVHADAPCVTKVINRNNKCLQSIHLHSRVSQLEGKTERQTESERCNEIVRE
jgi:hypothetical protein